MRIIISCFFLALFFAPLQAKAAAKSHKKEVAVSDKDLPSQPTPPTKAPIPLPQKNGGEEEGENNPTEEAPEEAGSDLNKLPYPRQKTGIEGDLNDYEEEETGDEAYPADLNKIDESPKDGSYDEPEEAPSSAPKSPTLKKRKNQNAPSPSPPPSAAQSYSISEEVQGRYPVGVILHKTKGLVLFGSSAEYDKINVSAISGLHLVDLTLPGSSVEFENRLNPIYLNKPLTREVIEKIIEEIEAFYREYYHPLVKVIIPKQSIEGGVLCLIVLESKLGKVSLQGNTWSSETFLREYLALEPNEPIDERPLRQSIDFMNRNPFRHVEAVYKEGQKYGTTDLDLMVYEKRPFRVFLGVDNMGLSAIGRTRVFGGFNYGNFLGLDQLLSYQFTASVDFTSYLSNTASWIIPLPWSNILEFYGGYSTVHSSMPVPFKKSHGFAMQASTRYTIPMKVFVRELTHEVRFGLDFKRMNNTLEFVEDFPVVGQYVNLSQLAMSYKAVLAYDVSKTTIEAEGYYSPGQIFGDQSKERYNSLRYGATPKYVYGRGEFKEEIFFQKTGEVMFRAAGQISSATLLPSEEFGLGGLETVRGYEERTLNGDIAALLSLEVKTPAMRGIISPHTARNGMVIEDKWQLVLFCDYGTALAKGPNISYTSNGTALVEPKRFYIAGAGPGVRYHIADYLYARADLGFKLKKEPALYGGGWAMVHFMVIANF